MSPKGKFSLLKEGLYFNNHVGRANRSFHASTFYEASENDGPIVKKVSHADQESCSI